MKTLIRYAAIFFAASLLAFSLGTGTKLPDGAVAEAQFGNSWTINSQTTDMTSSGPGGTCQNTSSTSERTSDDGQKQEDSQSSHKNEDGSSSEQEDFTHDDGKCGGGGYSRHTTTDKNGNRKVHYQSIWRENGKCEIVVVDEEYDKNNHRLSRKEKTYPCSQYKLEMRFEGSASPGFGTVEWGPHKAVIPLTEEDRTYKGSYEGQFNGTMSGECNGFAVYPVSVEVTAVEDQFQDLDFTIKLTMSMQATISCEDVSNSSSTPTHTGTRTFTLPSKDGASYTVATPGNEVRYTFTLRKQCGRE